MSGFFFRKVGRRQRDSGTLQRGFVLWRSSVAAAHKEELRRCELL